MRTSYDSGGDESHATHSLLSRTRTRVIFIAFALSGCAGLIYQSIWAQYLGLFLGHAAYAQRLVLTIFMGGMALGAWWASAYAKTGRNLLRAYAFAELGIGFAAAVFHPLFMTATQFAYDSGFQYLAGSAAVEPLKWLLAGLLIFPQSVLLGSTFPLLSNAVMRRLPASIGASLGGLYFCNSAGAAAGALLATFLLLPAVGLPGAMAFGAVLNLLVASATFLIARDPEPAPVPPVAVTRGEVGDKARTLLLSAAFVTGATSFAYEIGWVRMLSLVFGSTLHAFELMLAAFIGGLACGSAWIRPRIDRYTKPIRISGAVQIAMGLAALFSLLLYDHCFDAVAWGMRVLPRTDNGYMMFNAGTTILAIAVMAPTAFFAGMTLPLFTLALIREGGGERSVGRIYSANTVGAIVGIYVAAHWLIPQTGLKAAMIAAAVADLGLGLVLLWRSGAPSHASYAAAVCLVAVVATTLLAQFDPMAMAAGVYRNGKARFKSTDANIVFHRDGETASIAVIKGRDGALTISTNGKADASIQLDENERPTLDEITMIMTAVLPLATHPAPQTAAVIGFGSGLTTHTLLGDPRLLQVDTIEIEPRMVEGAQAFARHTARANQDSRSHVHIDDARAYFASYPGRYDIIIAEPSNPWVSGVGGLFSTEFYQLIPKHLNPGGVFVQWVQLYEINDELVAAIGRSLATTFADFRVYLANDTDAIIVSVVRGSLPELNDEFFQRPGLKEELQRVGLEAVGDLQLRQVGDRNSLHPMFDLLSQRSNSDFFPILSLEAPRARFAGTQSLALLSLTTADLPLREVLGHVVTVGPGRFVPNTAYTVSRLAEQAARIAAGLAGAEPVSEENQIAQVIVLARAMSSACADGSSDTQNIDILQQLAIRTVPFLDATQLQSVWINPNWIGCARPTEATRSMLGVIKALATRDFAQAGTNATAMLHAHRGALSSTVSDWLLRTAMLAAIAEGRYADVATLDATFGADVTSIGLNRLQRSYLRAFAETHLVPGKLH